MKELDAAGIDRSQLARDISPGHDQADPVVDRFFHGDPHPGNVMVNLDTSEIIFIDMGMMGELHGRSVWLSAS